MMRRAGTALLAPAVAVAFALVITSLVLVVIGKNPLTAFSEMAQYAAQVDSFVSIVNRAVPLYISALAVAIGFKMGLFNIGVEGQYLMAALVAAWAGTVTFLPAPLHVLWILLVAAAVGAAWAAVPAILKVTRGVHEVLSTIMMNAIAIGIVAYLLANYFNFRTSENDLILKTRELEPSGRMPSLNPVLHAIGVDTPSGTDLHGFLVVAALLGVAFYFLVWRTRFGFDLRASGINPPAAQASGVNPKRMVVYTMLLSGAIAGWIGMSPLLGFFHQYNQDFPTDLGFTGIAVALVGRNHPVGAAFAAIMWAFLDRSAQILDLIDIPKEVITITQGVIILSIVVSYAVVERIVRTQQVKVAARQTGVMQEAPA